MGAVVATVFELSAAMLLAVVFSLLMPAELVEIIAWFCLITLAFHTARLHVLEEEN